MLTIDSVNYDVDVNLLDLECSFEKISDEDSGRTQSLDMEIDILGVFYNYAMTIKRKNACSLADYDALWETLSAPVAFNTVTLPYGQTTLTFDAYITKGKRKLIRQDADGNNYYGDMTITFTAKSPQRRPT